MDNSGTLQIIFIVESKVRYITEMPSTYDELINILHNKLKHFSHSEEEPTL